MAETTTPHHRWTYSGTPGRHDSLAAHTMPNGGLRPERGRLHDQIIRDALAGHHPKGKPEITFLGGGPASGKSVVLAGGVRGDPVHIDADAIKAQLPEYQSMLAAGDKRAASYVHEESSALSKRLMAEAIARKANVLLDGTGDSAYDKLAGKVRQARDAGYRVHGRYVTVDTGEAVRRAAHRAERTGRHVPESFIRDTHAAVSDTFARAAHDNLFDTLELWDNNARTPRLIGSKAEGGDWTVHDPQAWQSFLAKGKQGAGVGLGG